MLEIGKLPDKFLSGILERYITDDNSVILGPSIGEDAGIIDVKDEEYLAVCVDPIMVGISNAPYFAVAININDIVTRGASPRWASSSIFFPEGSTEDDVRSFFMQLYKALRPYHISVVTGHTEVTSLVKNPSIIMTMIGTLTKDRMITTSGAKEGDSLVLTSGAGIEGTAILAEDYDFKGKVDNEVIERARKFIYDPGICVYNAAIISWNYGPNSLHDPTEGGIRKGIEEMATASGNGVYVEYDKIPIREETRILCESAGVDPLGIFGSGALLISIPPERVEGLLSQYSKSGIIASEIGKVTEKDMVLLYEGKEIELTASHKDGMIEDVTKL
ncbi:AIR synthase-related protein [candidate division KSB1 bacterium]